MNKSPHKPQKSWYKRPIWIIVIFFVIVLIGANGWLLYKDSHPQSYINFTQYEPTKIVDGLQIKNKTLDVWNSTLFSSVTVFVPYSIDLDLNLSRAGWYINEGKATIEDISLSQLDCNIVGVKCSLNKTPGGQAYAIYIYHSPTDFDKTPLVYDKLTEERLYFVKGGTDIMIRTQVDGGAPVTDKDWGDMIDSFKPTTFNDITVKHMHPGP